MSVTDTRRHITYANAAFIDVSGFSAEEIVGQPHNAVRHPDMPAAAFADMWATLASGASSTGLVKNRRKIGDHYWVRANATPVLRNGKPVAYMSVRTKPGREETAAAEKLYADVREGRAANLAFQQGVVVRRGAMAWRTWLKTMPVRWRVRLPVLGLVVATVAGAAACGLSGGTLGAFAGALAVLGALALWFIEAQVAGPLAVLMAHAQRVAGGDQGAPVQFDRVDEAGMTLRAINQLGLMFRWVIDDVAAQVVSASSTEIAAATPTSAPAPSRPRRASSRPPRRWRR